jgi:hypothetical protein
VSTTVTRRSKVSYGSRVSRRFVMAAAADSLA